MYDSMHAVGGGQTAIVGERPGNQAVGTKPFTHFNIIKTLLTDWKMIQRGFCSPSPGPVTRRASFVS